MGVELPVVPAIVGPTAVGKTALAVEWSKLLPLEVISADSRQLYRRLDIGTAKPTAAERLATPHHLVDHLDPGQPYNAGRFREDVLAIISKLPSGRVPVIVGGTGLYLKVLAEGFFEEPEIDKARRARLTDWMGKQGNPQEWAARLDPEYQAGGTHRTLRSVEVALLTGRPLSWWQVRNRSHPAIDPWYIRLTMDRGKLVERIELRVDAMLAAGLIEETTTLLSSGIDRESAGFNAVGYREVLRHLDGVTSYDEMRYEIVISTRQYAKRQETWFRNQLPTEQVLALDALDGAERNAERIAQAWNERPSN